MIDVTPAVSARVRLFLTRAALPAWIRAVLPLNADAEDFRGVNRQLPGRPAHRAPPAARGRVVDLVADQASR